jgi:hypothetical protein
VDESEGESLFLSRNLVFEEIVFLGSPPGGRLIGAKIKSENSRKCDH